ncbi:hypothetical protein GCM10009119_38160 [Algoriphagus jejuensis]|uniref:DUF2383 domain-containing protein n=1 Tax=Algoriphagus jejuensis TaxID=419934 RepID=A0ABP3YJK2_9BACT
MIYSLTDTPEILSNLVQIHIDRIERYQNAIENLKAEDQDLKALFVWMIGESQKCKGGLLYELNSLEVDKAQRSTTNGKLDSASMDIPSGFSEHDRQSILERCEIGEKVAQKAYKAAANDSNLPDYLRKKLMQQVRTLKQSYNNVRQLRESLVVKN